MTRDEVLKEFGRKDTPVGDGTETIKWIDKPWSHITDAMADEIVRLRAILAMLREPRDVVVDVLMQAHGGYPFMQSGANADRLTREAARYAAALRATVEAAERFVEAS